MKFLVVDVGNTSTAVGLWLNGRVSRVSHIDGDVSEVAQALKALQAVADVDHVAYASVVPRKDARFRSLFRKLALTVIPVNHETFMSYCRARGLGIDYPNLSEVGADRLADAAGAFERYGAPVLIMDFGTALTAAVVTHDCVWRGGVIAPGFPLMRDYLFERTAKLPRMELKGRVPKIGRSTEESMRFGALVGYRGMVREIVSQLSVNFSESFRLVATGGFARWALHETNLGFVIDPNLTLFGVGLVASHSIRK